jgi:hypothetical protein
VDGFEICGCREEVLRGGFEFGASMSRLWLGGGECFRVLTREETKSVKRRRKRVRKRAKSSATVIVVPSASFDMPPIFWEQRERGDGDFWFGKMERKKEGEGIWRELGRGVYVYALLLEVGTKTRWCFIKKKKTRWWELGSRNHRMLFLGALKWDFLCNAFITSLCCFSDFRGWSWNVLLK